MDAINKGPKVDTYRYQTVKSANCIYDAICQQM